MSVSQALCKANKSLQSCPVLLQFRAGSAFPVKCINGTSYLFEDNFDGTTLDTKKWNYNYTWGRTHNHRAYMVDSMVQVMNGQLRTGSKLKFISENTPPSFAIRDKIKSFYDLTGIEVEILTDDLPVVQQKVGIDLRSGNADYPLQYVQDKPIGAPFADFYTDLTPMLTDDTLPQDPEGYGDDVWFENFLTACGRYYDGKRIIALPY